MLIKAIRTYQAITFEKKNETFFTTVASGSRKVVELKLRQELMCVEVISPEDHLLVPFTNISAIHLVTEKALAEAAAINDEIKNRKTSGTIQDIKKPR
jgi:hypothetical protein